MFQDSRFRERVPGIPRSRNPHITSHKQAACPGTFPGINSLDLADNSPALPLPPSRAATSAVRSGAQHAGPHRATPIYNGKVLNATLCQVPDLRWETFSFLENVRPACIIFLSYTKKMVSPMQFPRPWGPSRKGQGLISYGTKRELPATVGTSVHMIAQGTPPRPRGETGQWWLEAAGATAWQMALFSGMTDCTQVGPCRTPAPSCLSISRAPACSRRS